MNYTIEGIADFCGGERFISIPGSMVRNVVVDHRDLNRKNAMFCALKGARVDGHSFIPKLIEEGVHHFLISDETVIEPFRKQANFILVKDVLLAMQGIAKEHRDNLSMPLIAITGSNGKTIVKEWLNQLIEEEFVICRSPKSFNSQIGVPLSLYRARKIHTLGIFEAGISQPNEMNAISEMLKPQYGIFTNLGDAHAAHFDSDEQKFTEKWKLFDHAETVIASYDQEWVKWLSQGQKSKCFFWSSNSEKADVYIDNIVTQTGRSIISLKHGAHATKLEVPFTDSASLENVLHCASMIIKLGVMNDRVISRFNDLAAVSMRMEVKRGIEQSVIIDDSYNSDLGSLQVALEQLRAQVDRERMVVLTDFRENDDPDVLYTQISKMLKEADVDRVVAIGPVIAQHANRFEPLQVNCFRSADNYWRSLDTKTLRHKAILIKGARKFKLEKLAQKLQAKQHETVLEIDLHRLSENLAYYRTKIGSDVRLMVMVKAFAYGSGGYEVASFLESQNIDYLGVAYADEGVELRRKGIRIPIMVMSPSRAAYESMIQYDLEPEIYSLKSLEEFIDACRSNRHLSPHFGIHLKVDSGMHRLGLKEDQIPGVLAMLKEAPFVEVKSIFSHLASSDASAADAFTHEQVHVYNSFYENIAKSLATKPMQHIVNSNGILRFPQYQFDMVRLGIGLYGFASGEDGKYLHALGTLKTYVVQTRLVPKGESVGYNRRGVAEVDREIATVAIGYADGIDRRLGNGQWKFKWQGHACSTVGDICMDMCMIDVTGLGVQEGDEVIVFEGSHEVLQIAKLLETIPYEVLTNVSERVRRVYLQE